MTDGDVLQLAVPNVFGRKRLPVQLAKRIDPLSLSPRARVMQTSTTRHEPTTPSAAYMETWKAGLSLFSDKSWYLFPSSKPLFNSGNPSTNTNAPTASEDATIPAHVMDLPVASRRMPRRASFSVHPPVPFASPPEELPPEPQEYGFNDSFRTARSSIQSDGDSDDGRSESRSAKEGREWGTVPPAWEDVAAAGVAGGGEIHSSGVKGRCNGEAAQARGRKQPHMEDDALAQVNVIDTLRSVRWFAKIKETDIRRLTTRCKRSYYTRCASNDSMAARAIAAPNHALPRPSDTPVAPQVPLYHVHPLHRFPLAHPSLFRYSTIIREGTEGSSFFVIIAVA